MKRTDKFNAGRYMGRFVAPGWNGRLLYCEQINRKGKVVRAGDFGQNSHVQVLTTIPTAGNDAWQIVSDSALARLK